MHFILSTTPEYALLCVKRNQYSFNYPVYKARLIIIFDKVWFLQKVLIKESN